MNMQYPDAHKAHGFQAVDPPEKVIKLQTILIKGGFIRRLTNPCRLHFIMAKIL